MLYDSLPLDDLAELVKADARELRAEGGIVYRHGQDVFVEDES